MGATLPEEWQPLANPSESGFNGDIEQDVTYLAQVDSSHRNLGDVANTSQPGDASLASRKKEVPSRRCGSNPPGFRV